MRVSLPKNGILKTSLISPWSVIHPQKGSLEHSEIVLNLHIYAAGRQRPLLCCGIRHLHSTWIRYVIPILELGEMRNAPGNPELPAKYNLSPWVAELSFSFFFFFFFPPGLAIWQKDSYIQQSRENDSILHPLPAIKITTQAELSAYREGFYGLKVSAPGRCSPGC